jgi:hypothetical protein
MLRDCLEIEFLAARPNRKISQTEKNLGAEFLARRRESLPFLRPQMGKDAEQIKKHRILLADCIGCCCYVIFTHS